MVEVILVEESLSESALACIAIALRRPGTRVREARSLREAAILLLDETGVTPLVILGPRSLAQPLERFMGAIKARAAVIGFANGVPEKTRERALRAGVLAVYERPLDWKDYAATIKGLLDGWAAAPEPRRA